MKKLALLFALLASPALANDNVTIIVWGTTAEAGPCQYATLAAAVTGAACTRTVTDTTNTLLGELVTAYQSYCNVAINGTCTATQVATYFGYWVRDQVEAYVTSQRQAAAAAAVASTPGLN